MATTLTIRNVPEEIRNELATRAARGGRSLQEYLRLHVIELASRVDSETILARVRARKREVGGRIDAETIVAHRDAERP